MTPDAAQDSAYLGIARSLTGRRWAARHVDPATVRDHQARAGLSATLAQLLAGRGVQAGEATSFLKPTLRAFFPDPSSFADMDLAARILVDGLQARTPTTVFADYDVDGATSAAQLIRWFRDMGHELSVYVPDRELEGYGPSAEAFARIKHSGAELVITVDCGAAAEQPLAAAAAMGLGVVVVDHHLMDAGPPPALAVVNPNRPDCLSGQGGLAAAGVTFVLLAALNREARHRGLFAARPEPNLQQWSDLAALGAICDVTPLVGFNRALAVHGLKTMSAWKNPGLKALMEVAKASGDATAYHAGFVLGPRINAGGRIGRADLGARLLSTDDSGEAAQLAERLDLLNQERRGIETEIFEATLAQLQSSNLPLKDPVLVVAGENWRPGVIGIVAGRLRERLRCPTIVIGVDPHSGLGKGSGRSRPGINLGRAIQAASRAGLLISGGGHAMAAGLTVEAARIPELRAFLCDFLQKDHEAQGIETLEIDALVGLKGIDRSLLAQMSELAPYGPGNPEPLIALADVRVERPILMKGGHVRVTLTDGAGTRLKAVAWRAGDTALGDRLMQAGSGLCVAGRLRADDWQGRQSVELEIEDVGDPRLSFASSE